MLEDFSPVSLLIGLLLGGGIGWGVRHWQARRELEALTQRYMKAKKQLKALTTKSQQDESERDELKQNLVQALKRPARPAEGAAPVAATPAPMPNQLFDSSLIGIRPSHERDFADTQIVHSPEDR